MEQYVNIGSVSIYSPDGIGGYEYSFILAPEDYVTEDATIHLRDNMGFGSALEFQDDRVIVGCPYEEPYNEDGDIVWENYKSGSVYVFDKNDGSLIQHIVPDNTPNEWTSGTLSGIVRKKQNFGFSLAAGDDYIVVGAPGYTDNTSSTEYEYSGRVYIYKWNNTSSIYELSHTITPASKIAYNRFGNSVVVDGDNIVITNAPKSTNSNAGAIRFITLNSARTASTLDVKILNTHTTWQYGIALADNRIAVGDPTEDVIYVYKITDGVSQLTHTISDELLKSFEFGYSLEFSNDKLIIGCPNGYYKLGIVLQMGQVSGTYTLI